MSENKTQKNRAPEDPKLAYLRNEMGMRDVTAADLKAPEVGQFRHRASNDFEWTGKLHPSFEYYRATDDRSVQVAEAHGYIRLPNDCGVRMMGCHTKDEIIMARTTETAEAFRAAQRERVAQKSAGTFDQQTPLGEGIYSNERMERTPGASPMRG